MPLVPPRGPQSLSRTPKNTDDPLLMNARRKAGRKVRVEFRKNRQSRTRANDLTRSYDDTADNDNAPASERVSGKGDLTRKRTIITADDADAPSAMPAVEPSWIPGRVLRAVGLRCEVDAADGRRYDCRTRRLLKSLTNDGRASVVTGDQVWLRPASESEAMIERIEPRRGVLSRTSRNRQHVMVANVDQVFLVASAAEPALKPHLIDRMLISAEHGEIEPIVLINKVDLVAPEALVPLLAGYAQVGYRTLLVSAKTGQGIERLRRWCQGRETAVSGQSGVGKSSLLNAIEPGLELRVSDVRRENEKGRHTTTSAQLLPLASGGWLVDTPGIRQFELWDVIPEEVAGYFPEMRPFINLCRFPNCTHTHEADCGVKDAVADMLLDARRYESYLNLVEDQAAGSGS